ncbi:MAG: ATP-binding protein [Helicobacter sp.]|nr:ATP-binding protein [Helicobacter sp.]
MKTYEFVIRNFRNIGLCEGNKSQEAFLRLSGIKGELGGLTILIGKYNSGKSNLLRALKKFGDSCLHLEGSQNFEGMQLLSQDDVPESASILTSVALACQEPAYYLQYSEDVAQKSGAAQKKRQMGEAFDLTKHIRRLQKDFDSLDVYLECNESETIKLLLKDSSGAGRFMRCTIEPLKNIDDHSVDELNTINSKKLDCSFIVGYEELNVKQNFADYINGASQHVKSSAAKEYGHIICLENDGKLHQKYYTVRMNDEGDENALLYRYFQKTPNKKHEQLRVPKIVLYKEMRFDDADLSTMPDKIKESKLFRGGITKKLMQINHDFNALCGEEGEESYQFELNIDIDKFALEIRKGKQLLSLEEQGIGFKRLFDFVFSLTQQIDGLEKGDIVLIDDVEKSLSGSIQTRLRKYLKELAQKRGIFFIVSTHSPFMIDCNCLDEIRLLKTRDNGHGTEIVNDVSLDIAHQDSLLEHAFRAQQPNSLVFVEDIAMCHFLSIFALMYAQEKGRDLKLVFLPVPSLENKQERTKMLESLIDFNQSLHAAPVIFVVDKEDEWERNEKIQIFVNRNQNKTGFKYLFSEQDRERFGIGDTNEARFLQYSPELVGKLDQETKDGFYKTLEVLHKEAYENEQDNEGGKA